MARSINRLTPRTVASLDKKGYYADGGGLYLQVSAYGTKSWLYRFTMAGRAREMGLGAIITVTLARARQEAEKCRDMIRDGKDPIELRNAVRQAAIALASKSMSFKQCAEAYIGAHEAGWKNDKHISQWRNTLRDYVYPILGELAVDRIDEGHVLKVLEPIWKTKTETASRVRGRIESVLDWATVRKYRTGENPARWKGHLDHILPARSKVQKPGHHAALGYARLGAFMAELRTHDGIGARGLEFAILTAARTGEVLGATWDEIDLDKKIWIIPAERMKAGKEHRVPLSKPALDILERMKAIRQGAYVFGGAKPDKPLSNMSMLMVLRRMKRDDLTTHGFRSTFRDWAAERTNYPREVAEMALAHTIGDKVEAAYRRGDLFEKRVRLMDEWAAFCFAEPSKATDNVTAIRGAVAS